VLRKIAIELNAEGAPTRSSIPVERPFRSRHRPVGGLCRQRCTCPTVRGGGSNARQRRRGATYDATWMSLVDAEQWHTVRRLLLDSRTAGHPSSESGHASAEHDRGVRGVRLAASGVHAGRRVPLQVPCARHVQVPMAELDEMLTNRALASWPTPPSTPS